MIGYFKLQFILTKRKLYDATLMNSYLVVVICSLLFVGVSIALFRIIDEYAQYLYILGSLYFTIPLGEINRNDFLKSCFSQKDYRIVRLLENLMVSLPFVVFLLIRCLLFELNSDGINAFVQYGIPILLLVVISCILSLLNFKSTNNITIPTPFYKKPFEFILGFRDSFLLYIIPYILTIIAIRVDNFSLGIFSVILVFVVAMHYYMTLENEYFVWVHSFTPAGFLMEKIKTALLYSLYLCLPLLILLGIFYFKYFGVLLLVVFLGYLYMTVIILAKYSTYPDEISIEKGVLLAGCLVMPPLLLVIIPYYARQSLNRLRRYL